MIDKFNEAFNEQVGSTEELLSRLSEEFEAKMDKHEDAQEAFNDLDADYNGFVGQHFLYTLSAEGEEWQVATGEAFKEQERGAYAESLGLSNEEATTDELLSYLERRVGKDMDNVGCDAKNALRMNLEEAGLEGIFCIKGADAPPRIVLPRL